MNKWNRVTDLRIIKKGDLTRVTYPDGRVEEGVALFGADADSGAYAGAFCWHVGYVSGNRYRAVGTRQLDNGTVVPLEGYKVEVQQTEKQK